MTIAQRLASPARITILVASLFAPPAAGGQGSPADSARASQNDPRPVMRAVRRTGAIVVDGRLDDDGWRASAVSREFRQQHPDEGRSPTQPTELRILYDDHALYIGARMFDADGADGVRKLLVRRDQLLHDNGSDKIAVVLDPYRDRQTSVWFELNPLGVKGDHLNGDASFDPVWSGASHTDSLGWTAEFRIPLSQLRFPRDSVQRWGLQVWRTLARRNEGSMWAFWRRNEPGGAGYFGTIEGLVLTRQPRQLELMPYVVQKSTHALPATGNPFRRRQEMTARAGADVKYNLSSSFTLDATVNPDFGQVEVDPAVVNLTAFETTFQEKRPFFVANAPAFSFGNVSCFFCNSASNLGVFYSRRIGRAPQLAGLVQPGNHADFADASTILGAAKLTGRTKGGLSVAVLEALANSVTARFVPRATPDATPTTREIEPKTNYLLGRVRQDLRNGDTRIGMIGTLTNRLISDTAHASRLRRRAGVLGADVQHYWGRRGYSFVSQVALSEVAGDTGAIRRTQLTSTHYAQRPDRRATHDGLFDFAYDPTRTTLRGYGLYARIAKESGDWRWETAQNWKSPGFEVNDIAALTRTDFKWMQASVMRSWTRPSRWYRAAALLAGGQQQLNYDGDRTDLQGTVWGEATLPSYIRVQGHAVRHPPTYDQFRTRGGVVVKSAGYHIFAASLQGDARRRLSWTANALYGPNIADEGWYSTGNVSLVAKPAENIRLSVGPSFLRDVDPRGFVANITDSAATRFSGVRSVFAKVEQRTFGMTTRVDATFSPTLTLELFAQPFIAAGRYDRYNEYAEPRTTDARFYGQDAGSIAQIRDSSGRVTHHRIDPDGDGPGRAFTLANPDFNLRSLRGTAVVRWEYRPGSTLFMVWTQQRSGGQATGGFDLDADRRSLLSDRPVNVFQVKASYWVGL